MIPGPDWIADALTLAAGVALLIAGGDVLVRGAVALATRLGVAPLLIGLSVVAFGTSAPELALNISAALNSNTDLSFGNIIGSNIANIGLILGLSALIKPMAVNSSLIKREIPILIGVSVLTVALAYAPPHAPESMPQAYAFARPEGALFIAGFVGFLWLLTRAAKKGERVVVEEVADEKPVRPWLALGLLIGGLIMLALGGALAERGAVGVARAAGLSDAVIGLTVVAVATSLPELATSVMAARRGQIDIAVGNVVGSNLFNILLVLGVTASIAPTPIPAGGGLSLGVMLLLAALLLPMSKTHSGFISRLEGALLLLIYTAAVAVEVARA